MATKRRSKAASSIDPISLALGFEQANQLQRSVSEASNARAPVTTKWVKSSKLLSLRTVHELNLKMVCVRSDAIEIPGLPAIPFVRGRRLNGLNPATDRVFLVSSRDGWSVEIRIGLALQKNIKKKRREPRLHSHAAIFVTGKTGHRVLNGGLPSLGKRK